MGGMLLVLIAVGETILHEFDLPAWPPLFVMLFFFLTHMDKKAAPNIIIGALVGMRLLDDCPAHYYGYCADHRRGDREIVVRISRCCGCCLVQRDGAYGVQ